MDLKDTFRMEYVHTLNILKLKLLYNLVKLTNTLKNYYLLIKLSKCKVYIIFLLEANTYIIKIAKNILRT